MMVVAWPLNVNDINRFNVAKNGTDFDVLLDNSSEL